LANYLASYNELIADSAELLAKSVSYQEMKTKAQEEHDWTKDPHWKRWMLRMATNYENHSTYSLTAREFLERVVIDLEAAVTALTGVRHIRSHAKKPTQMNSTEELIERDQQMHPFRTGMVFSKTSSGLK